MVKRTSAVPRPRDSAFRPKCALAVLMLGALGMVNFRLNAQEPLVDIVEFRCVHVETLKGQNAPVAIAELILRVAPDGRTRISRTDLLNGSHVDGFYDRRKGQVPVFDMAPRMVPQRKAPVEGAPSGRLFKRRQPNEELGTKVVGSAHVMLKGTRLRSTFSDDQTVIELTDDSWLYWPPKAALPVVIEQRSETQNTVVEIRVTDARVVRLAERAFASMK